MNQSNQNLSDKDWENIIHSWEQSGKSQEDYCKENNITMGCFAYRRSKLRKANKKPSKQERQSKFMAVNLVSKSPESHLEQKVKQTIDIQLPEGMLIKMPLHFKKSLVAFILEKMGA